MADPYIASDDVYDLMRDLVANHHPDLASCVDEIAILFKEKASMQGGNPVVSTVSKASPVLRVLGAKEYRFVITIAGDCWNAYSPQEREAEMAHCLLACRVEDADDGGYTYSLARPDVSYFYDELARYGAWRKRPESTNATVDVSEIFGAKPPAEA